MCRYLITAATWVVALASLASAGEKEPDWYGGIVGKDDRQFVETTEPPWGAIGQINVSGASSLVYCTGTLVAHNLVLTAAHCLVNFRNYKPYIPETVHFVAGVRRDKRLGHSVAKCLLFPKEYNPVVEKKTLPGMALVPMEAFVSDIAAIVLAGPIPVEPVPVRPTEFEEGLPLMFGGYMADHRYMLTADRECD